MSHQLLPLILKAFSVSLALVLLVPMASADPLSYSQLVMSEKPNVANSKIGSVCVQALRRHFGNHKRFATTHLLSSVVEVKDIPFDEVSDGVFFHYDNSEEARRDAESGNKAAFFSKRILPNETEADFYVAGDPYSSSSYGRYQIQAKTSTSAKVFVPAGIKFWQETIQHRLQPGGDGYSDYSEKLHRETINFLSQVVQEITDDEPELVACGTKTFDVSPSSWTYNLPALVLLALEQEGIGLSAYCGTSLPWFQILDPSVVEYVRLGPLDNPGAQFSVPHK